MDLGQGARSGSSGAASAREQPAGASEPGGRPLEDLGVDVEVRVDRVDVVVVLERVDEAHELRGVVLLDWDARVR